MLYPENIEVKIGFDQIRELLKKECLSPLGEGYVEKMKFSSDLQLITNLIAQTAEFKKILQLDLSFPSKDYIDVVPYFEKIKPEGSLLEPEIFRDLKLSIFTIASCINFFERFPDEEYTALRQLTKAINLDRNIFRSIDKVVDDNGLVKDGASSELWDIRKNLITQQSGLRKELDRILKSVKKDGFADEQVEVTIRSGRMVIPVLAEYKRKVRGFIHDESATGQTVFIEPAEIFEVNNQIKELEHQERREILEILIQLTDEIRPFVPDLKKAYKFLALIDFIRAKALLAVKMNAVSPHIEKAQIIRWVKARHPLLYLSFKKQNREVVPLNISLDKEKRILIISGPNAGGKSVCLKTVGLLQYMFQCGLLVPLEEFSNMGIFKDIFIDIGDEQSIENDLSTYSSHLKNMKQFLSFAGSKSLVLIDEFGTGTEPHFGAAIAEAVLEQLNKPAIYGVITTHYTNLKSFAERTEGVVNGAMRFDIEKLEPLYELEIGNPGSSFALEIATKIGLPMDLIESSKLKLGEEQVSYDKLLRELELEKTKVLRQNEKLKGTTTELDKLIAEYTESKEFIDTHKKKLLNEAKAEAKELLKEVNQKIESAINEIRKNKGDKEITKKLRNDLENFNESLKMEEVKDAESNYEVMPGEIKTGDLVRVKNTGALGEIISIKDKDAEIMIGELKSTVKLNRLDKISRKEYRSHLGEENIVKSKGINLQEKMGNFSPNIDLRGKRTEEALKEIDSLIDSAIIFAAPELKIIHGKGDGILRTLIREHLKTYKEVKSFTDEHADRGGAGVTLVKLK
ncbi:MAG TPA: endonuclease MutS2 [Cytophagaceae bacterium]|jgi:DNA mismatch repair protein MutS2|nr:endonuclease MutS2 [Cytophagaceae bacterium]